MEIAINVRTGAEGEEAGESTKIEVSPVGTDALLQYIPELKQANPGLEKMTNKEIVVSLIETQLKQFIRGIIKI